MSGTQTHSHKMRWLRTAVGAAIAIMVLAMAGAASATPPAPGAHSVCPAGSVGGILGEDLTDSSTPCIAPGAPKPPSVYGFMSLRAPLTANESPSDTRIVSPIPALKFRGWARSVPPHQIYCFRAPCPQPKTIGWRYAGGHYVEEVIPGHTWFLVYPWTSTWRWGFNYGNRSWYALHGEDLEGYCESPRRGYSNCSVSWVGG